MAWTHSGVPGTHRGVIDFDLSMISPGSTVLHASLDLFYESYEGNGVQQSGDNASYLMRILEPWEEDEITWNNQPATSQGDAITLPTSTYPDQDYMGIDVTDFVQLMISDPENNHGFMFRLVTEQYYRCMLFASGDGNTPAKWPRLTVIYMGCIVPSVDFEYSAENQTVSFTGISSTATSWHWDFGDGDTSDVQNPEHYYQEEGFYQVCLTVEDSCYFAEKCKEIEICLAPPEAGFEYITDNLRVDFLNASYPATTFFWDFGDEYYSSLENPSHTYDIDGDFLVCLAAGNSCGNDTICQWISLCAIPVSNFTYYMDGFTAYFTDLSEFAYGYFWDFGDGYYSTLPEPWHEYESPGNYEVCLSTSNSCGNDTLCTNVHITTVSVDEQEGRSFIVYPNPAKDKFYIRTDIEGEIEMLLSDLNGRQVIARSAQLIKGENYLIETGALAPGLYILRVVTEKRDYFSKLIIEP